MVDLRTQHGEVAWQALQDHPSGAVWGTDLDGTTHDVVEWPDTPNPDPALKGRNGLFRKLSRQVGASFILTGRSVDQTYAYYGEDACHDIVVLGEFGSERGSRARRELWLEAPRRLLWFRQRLAALVKRLNLSDVVEFEEKAVSTAIHYHSIFGDVRRVERLLGEVEALAKAAKLEVHPAHGFCEVTPLGIDKQGACERFLFEEVPIVLGREAPSVLVYHGDAATDELVYDVYEQQRQLAGGVPTLLVCVGDNELLVPRADIIVSTPADNVTLLGEMVDITRPGR